MKSGAAVKLTNEESILPVKATRKEYASPFPSFRDRNESTTLNKLLGALEEMSELIINISGLNRSIKLIEHHCAVEAARTELLSQQFSSLVHQITEMIDRSDYATIELEDCIRNLLYSTKESIGVQLSERAHDIIDKIDRNLFERNCDCQAWATFSANVQCLIGKSDIEVQRASELLSHLQKVYMVYSNILLIDNDGRIVSVAQQPEIVGADVSREHWFKEGIAGNVNVTDLHFCPYIKAHTVAYTAPVKDNAGNIVGVISTRFDWNYVHEILENATVGKDNHIWVVNEEGVIIASKDKVGILTDNLSWLDIGQMSMSGQSGFSVERKRNGDVAVFGCARTKGYNNYPGKKWSVIVAQPIIVKNYIQFARFLQQPAPGSEQRIIHSEISNETLRNNSLSVNESIEKINDIHSETYLMSVNAEIKSERAGASGTAFSVLSNQIRILTVESEGITARVNRALATLAECVAEVQVKIKDAAIDAIDKADRNLFERYCDVQAWTVFDELVECAVSKQKSEKACALLKQLHKIYEIYSDVFLLDTEGKILAVAIDETLIGNDCKSNEWFSVPSGHKIYFSDMYECELTKSATMTFSAPVLNRDGRIVGVLSTRFNWKFIYDILSKVSAPEGSIIYLTNSSGLIIASSNHEGILTQSFGDRPWFAECHSLVPGIATETDMESGTTIKFAYAKASGYNSYEGKGWVVIVEQKLKNNLII